MFSFITSKIKLAKAQNRYALKKPKTVPIDELIIGISACIMYFIDKYPNERRPGNQFFKYEIRKRITAHAKRNGHKLHDFIVDYLMEFAVEYLETRNAGVIVGLINSCKITRSDTESDIAKELSSLIATINHRCGLNSEPAGESNFCIS